MTATGSRRFLLAAVTIAVATSAAWAGWVWNHTGPQISAAAAGATVQTSDGASFQLVELTASDTVVSLWGQTLTPAEGAVFVTARVRFDSRSATGAGLCTFLLHAGDLSWTPDSFSPPRPAVSSCASGESGVVVSLYQVPRGWVDRVDGVMILDPAHPGSLLTGRIG